MAAKKRLSFFFWGGKISRGLIFGVVILDLHSNSRRNKASSTSIELLAMPSHLDNLGYSILSSNKVETENTYMQKSWFTGRNQAVASIIFCF